MTVLDDMRLVLLLACETGDRDNAEQRALLRVAVKLDNQANALTSKNIDGRDGPAWRLVDAVLGTDSDMGRNLPKSLIVAVERTWRRADEWDRAREQVA